jgi:hypothetical protein
LPELWYSKILTNFEMQFVKIIGVAKKYNMTIILGAFIERSKNISNFPIIAFGRFSSKLGHPHPASNLLSDENKDALRGTNKATN